MKQRNTPQLMATLAVVTQALDHPTAEQVLQRVRHHLPHVSLGTVYRNLDKLRHQGRLRVLRSGDGVARYDARVAEHDHFLCDACGDVRDLERLPRPADLSQLQQDGYVIQGESLAVHGLCRRCAPGTQGRRASRSVTVRPRRPRAGDRHLLRAQAAHLP